MHQARTHAFTFTEIPIARFFFQKQQKKTLKRFSFTHLQSLAIVEISMHVTVRLKKKKMLLAQGSWWRNASFQV